MGADPAARVLVLMGSGRGFCSGLDLDLAAGLPAMTAPEMLAGQESWAGAIAALRRLPKPVIAAVNGPAAGAGLALALAGEIARHSPFAIRLTKQVLQANVDAPSLEAALELENRNQVLSTRSPEFSEALTAFRERRKPR